MTEQLGRREFVKRAGYLSAGTGLAGVARLAGWGNDAATAAPASARSVTWLTHPVFGPLTKDLVAQYKQTAGVDVIVDTLPLPGLREKAYLELSSGSDRYDLISLSQDVWTWDINPALEPLDGLLTALPPENPNDVSKRLLDMFRAGDKKLYGWPLRSGVFLMFYRRDLYEAARLSIPTTFDDYLANAKALNKPPAQYGVFVMGTQDTFDMHDWMEYFFNFGGRLVSSDLRRCLVNSPQGLKATQYWLNLVRQKLTPPGTASAKWDDEIAALQQGLACQALAWSPYTVNVNDPAKSKTAGKWGWAVAPRDAASRLGHSTTFLTCWGAYVPKASRKKEAAFKFLTWLTNPKNDLVMATRGNGPVRDSTYLRAEFTKIYPNASIILEATKYGNPGLPPVKKRPEITVVFDSELNAGVAGQKSALQVVDSITEQVNRLLAAG